MQTYSVRREPFSVPEGYEVLRSAGYGALGDSVLVSVKNENLGSANPTASQQLIVHRHKNVTGNPEALLLLAKLLKLQVALPADMPSTLPIVDAYCTSDAREDIYLAYPVVDCSLADLIRSSTALTSAQIVFVVRELAIALRNFHASKIVLGGGVRPEAIGVTTPLMNKNSLTLMDFTFVEADGDPKQRGALSLCGKGIEEARDSNGQVNNRLVFQTNLCFFAPEDVLQLQPAATTQSDMWSLGCILFSLMMRKPPFVATDTDSFMSQVTSFLGMPTDTSFIKNPAALKALQVCGSNKAAIPLPLPLCAEEPSRQLYLVLKRLLVMDPSKRATADDLLGLPIFTGGVGGAIAKPPLITVPPSWKLELGGSAALVNSNSGAAVAAPNPAVAAMTSAIYDVVRVM